MLELRRTKAGMFEEKTTINLYDFDKAVEEYKKGNEKPLRKILTPADEAIKEVLPVVQLNSKNIKQLLTGKPLTKEDIKGKLPKEEVFAAFLDDKFIEVAKQVKDKYLVAKPLFVLN